MAISTRPTLFDEANNARSIYQQTRKAMLDEDFDEILQEWIATNSGDETTQTWGVPDTAINPIAHNTRQLVTPGLYGRPVQLQYDPKAEPLLGKGGHFEKAGIWPRAQTLQYYTVGHGIYFRKINVVDHDGEPTLIDRIVPPANVVAFTRDDDPMKPVALWEMRYRKIATARGKESWQYVYDQYDISDPANPFFRVMRLDIKGRVSDDVTNQFVDGTDRWDWSNPEGKAFLPWIVYRSVDTGEFWPCYRRGMHRGTLRSCEHWTYTSRSALFATGEHVLITGVDTDAMPGVRTKRGDENADALSAPLLGMRVTPGMMSFLPTSDGKTAQAIHIGPGVNLPNLASFANMYHMVLALGDGLHPTDATRQSANPTSGSALEISSESRREFSVQVKPFFLSSDTELIQKASWMFSSVGEEYPVDDMILDYETVPLTPQERSDMREDLEWKKEQGLMSSVDVYLRFHPTATREQAKKAVIQARIEEAEIDAEVEKLAPKTKPDPNAPDPSVDPTQDPQNPTKPDPKSVR